MSQNAPNKKKTYIRLTIVIISLIFAACLFYVSFTYILNFHNFKSLFDLSKINWYFAIYLFLFVFVFGFLFGLVQYIFICIYFKKFWFWDMIWLGFGYNLMVTISPFGFLGDVLKIYIFTKNKINISKIIPAIVLNSFFFQIINFFISLFALIYLLSSGAMVAFQGTIPFIILLFIIGGLLIDICYAGFLLLLVVSKKFHYLIINIILYFTKWLKIDKTDAKIQDRRKILQKSFSNIELNIKFAFKSTRLLLVGIITTFVLCLVRALVPIFSFLTLNYGGKKLFATSLAGVMIEVANNLIPIPSGSGFFDIGYYSIYQNYLNISPEIVKRSLLLVRFTLTLSVIAIGLFALPVNIFFTTKKKLF